MKLDLTARIADPDGFYEALVEAQRELSDAEAQRMLAKLVLLLANHVGDRQVLSEALQRACPRAAPARAA